MRRFCPKYESTIPFRVSRKWNFEILWNPWNHGRFGSQMITQKLHSTLLGTTDLTYHKSRARHEMSSSWNKILNSTSHNVSESDLTYHYVGRLCRNHSLSFNITSNQHKKRLTIGVPWSLQRWHSVDYLNIYRHKIFPFDKFSSIFDFNKIIMLFQKYLIITGNVLVMYSNFQRGRGWCPRSLRLSPKISASQGTGF